MESIEKVFNHSKAIHNEIKYFVGEFENGKNKNDTEKMLKCGELATTVNSKFLFKSCEFAAENLPKLHAKVLVCNEMCSKIERYDERTKEFDQKQRDKNEARKIEFEKLQKEVTEQKQMISDEFQINSTKIQNEYKDLADQVHRENSYN